MTVQARTFPPSHRLRRRGEFQHVFETGRRVHGRYLTIIAAPAAGTAMRLGIVASRKLGGAVVRNRAKRLIREAFRHTSGSRPPLDLVVIPKPAMLGMGVGAVSADFEATLTRGFGQAKV